jgi:hypothetical protein
LSVETGTKELSSLVGEAREVYGPAVDQVDANVAITLGGPEDDSELVSTVVEFCRAEWNGLPWDSVKRFEIMQHSSTYDLVVKDRDWSLQISMTATVKMGLRHVDGGRRVNSQIVLVASIEDTGLAEDPLESFAAGLLDVAVQIDEATAGEPLAIEIEDLLVQGVPFEDAGLEVAMMHWAAAEFGFERVSVECHFDESKGRFVFDRDR